MFQSRLFYEMKIHSKKSSPFHHFLFNPMKKSVMKNFFPGNYADVTTGKSLLPIFNNLPFQGAL